MRRIPLILLLLVACYSAFAVYDPSTGRWLSRDPAGEGGGLNLYAYCNNNPVNLVDPLGLKADDNHLFDHWYDYLRPSSLILTLWTQFWKDSPTRFTVTGHADANSLGKFTSPEDYVDFMVTTDAWKAKATGIQEVRFMACNTGTGDWAQRAANRIKAVTGRTNILVTAPNGFISWTVSPDDYLIGYKHHYNGALGFEKTSDIVPDPSARLTTFKPQ